jgi:hypothetical protein
MMPPSMRPGQSPGYGQASGANDAVEELGMRAEALWRRLVDVERALAVQEWWMLGRVLVEARTLAEIASLFAVARGEMENALEQYFARAVPLTGQGSSAELTGPAEPPRSDDPAWIAASRDQAIGLLRMVASALPPMLQYAQMLQEYGTRAQLATGAVDAFGIVADRLNEIGEALQQPPV